MGGEKIKTKNLVLFSLTLIAVISILGCVETPKEEPTIPETTPPSTPTATPYVPETPQPTSTVRANLTVYFIDIGQGDSILVQFPNGNNMLVDGGDRGKGDDVVAYLRAKNVSNLTVVLATHPDADHITGLIEVLQNYTVGLFIDNGMTHTTQTYQNLHSIINQKNISRRIVRDGDAISIDTVVNVTILAPPQPLITGSRSDRNANTIVILLDYNNTEILLTGDPEEETEQFLIIKAVDIDILKVGHHGSKYASSDMFLDAFKPEIGIISVGANNRYGHPHPEVLGRLVAHGIVVYRTDLNGNIIATTDGMSYAIIPERAS